jgi:hypothetical protein
MKCTLHRIVVLLRIFTVSVHADRVGHIASVIDLELTPLGGTNSTRQRLHDEVARVCPGSLDEIANCEGLNESDCCDRKYCGYVERSCHFLADVISGSSSNECPRMTIVQYGILPAQLEDRSFVNLTAEKVNKDVKKAMDELKFITGKARNLIVAVYDIVAEPDRSRTAPSPLPPIQRIPKRMDPGEFATVLSQELRHISRARIRWRLYRTIRAGEEKEDIVSWVAAAASSIKDAGGVLDSVVIAGNSRNNRALRTEAAVRAVAEAPGVNGTEHVSVGAFADPSRPGENLRAMRRFACGAAFLSSQIALDPTYARNVRAISPHMSVSTTLVRMEWTLKVLDRLGVRWPLHAPPPVLKPMGPKATKQEIDKEWADATVYLTGLLTNALPGPIAFESLSGGPKTRRREIEQFFVAAAAAR